MNVLLVTRYRAGRNEYRMSEQECADLVKLHDQPGKYKDAILIAIQAKKQHPDEANFDFVFSEDPMQYFMRTKYPDPKAKEKKTRELVVPNPERQDFVRPEPKKKDK